MAFLLAKPPQLQAHATNYVSRQCCKDKAARMYIKSTKRLSLLYFLKIAFGPWFKYQA